jgi:hypothetical protein
MRSRCRRGTETSETGENPANNIAVAASLLILDGVERGVPKSNLRSRGRRNARSTDSAVARFNGHAIDGMYAERVFDV